MQLMKWQIGSSDGRRRMQIGRDDALVADFRPAQLLDQIRGVMLRGEIERMPVGLMRPAPWNGSKWRVITQGRDLATAEYGRIGPLNRRHVGVFEVTWAGRRIKLEATDPHGHGFALSQFGTPAGALRARNFEPGAPWYADLEVPAELPVATVAFLGWLTREGRTDLSRARGR
jgi:hypothetical protein